MMKKVLPLREMADTFGLESKCQNPAVRQTILQLRGKGCAGVLENVHAVVCVPVDGAVEREYTLQDFLRHPHRTQRSPENFKLIDDIAEELIDMMRIQ